MNKIHDIRVTVTRGETEALLLEENLIKSQAALQYSTRDDKSYPYTLLSEDGYPRLSFYEVVAAKRSLFGPYPSANATENSPTPSKVFRVRQYNDSYLKINKACLRYQIIAAPVLCKSYFSGTVCEDVEYSVMFLQGKSSALTKN